MKAISGLFLLFAVFLLISCDKEGDYYYSINNTSDYTLKLCIKPHYKNSNNKDTVISIDSKLDIMFSKQDYVMIGDLDDRFITNFFDTLYITINDTLQLSKNLYDSKNWVYEKHVSGGFMEKKADYYYKFELKNDDILKK
jgi:hypothetical protein